MDTKQVMQMALDALWDSYNVEATRVDLLKAIKKLEAALAQSESAECDGGKCGIGGYCKQCPKTQSEQEPVATVYDAYDTYGIDWYCKDAPAAGTKLYTAPPKREWVGLTEEERLEIIAVGGEAAVLYVTEAKLKEKNT